MNQSNTPTWADSPVHEQIREAGLDPISQSTPEEGPWEAYCDECYYHMWRLRRKTERGWHDGFHINKGDEAKGLCDLLNKLERERDEAVNNYETSQLLAVRVGEQRDEAREAADKWEKIAHDKLSEVCRQIEKTRFVTEQRDRAAANLERALTATFLNHRRDRWHIDAETTLNIIKLNQLAE